MGHLLDKHDLVNRTGLKFQNMNSLALTLSSDLHELHDLTLVSPLLGELLFFQQLKKSNQKKAARSARATHTLSQLPCHGSS
mgnify:CR=1 FL=1